MKIFKKDYFGSTNATFKKFQMFYQETLTSIHYIYFLNKKITKLALSSCFRPKYDISQHFVFYNAPILYPIDVEIAEGGKEKGGEK
jgi:hypothetical protein